MYLTQLFFQHQGALLLAAIALAAIGIYTFYRGIKHLSLGLILTSMFLAYITQNAITKPKWNNQQISIASYQLNNDISSAEFLLPNIIATEADLIAISGMPQPMLPAYQNQLVARGYCFPQISSSIANNTYEALFSRYPTYNDPNAEDQLIGLVEVPWNDGIEVIHFLGQNEFANSTFYSRTENNAAWVSTVPMQPNSRGRLVPLQYSQHFSCLSFQEINNHHNHPIGFVGRYALLEAPSHGIRTKNTEL